MKPLRISVAGIGLCGFAGIAAGDQVPPPGATNASAATAEPSLKTRLSGDFRLRYERTTYPAAAPDQDKGVLRWRLALEHSVNEYLAAGARLTTGARDNPRTTDVTIADFGKDLEISLDQAYADLHYKALSVLGGRFVNPLLRPTEMVWDGDVNPQGLAGALKPPGLGKLSLRLTGLFYLLDVQASGDNSSMLAGQAAATIAFSESWSLIGAVGYDDYTIESLKNAGAVNIRGNNLDASGTAYLSDFDLLDASLDLRYRGLGPRLPLGLTLEWVKNLGAAVPEDQGVTFDVWGGRLEQKGDIRARYGYAVVETDAVLGTYSHDNIPLATNYRLHTLAAEWGVLPHTNLNVTLYLYRENEPRLVDGASYQSRLRVNATFTF